MSIAILLLIDRARKHKHAVDRTPLFIVLSDARETIAIEQHASFSLLARRLRESVSNKMRVVWRMHAQIAHSLIETSDSFEL